MDAIEKTLEEMLVKKAPIQIPENGRKWIAEYAWIFALVGLIVGVFGFLSLLSVLGLFSLVATSLGVGHYVFLAWISLFVLGGYLVVLGISVPKLKNKEVMGWKLTYYSTLFFFAYDLFNFLAYPRTGAFFGFVWNLAWLVVALYVIFQVKSQFTGKAKTAKK